MPRRDGTGPAGQCERRGKRNGFCAGNINKTGNFKYCYRRRADSGSVASVLTDSEKKDARDYRLDNLRDEAEFFKKSLDEINREISRLESND